jgi:ketosteroid isomerase-like protein
MTDRDAVRAAIEALQHRAEAAFVRGDVEPRLASWSHADPVSVFAALGPSRSGWDQLEPLFRSVAARLTDGRDLTYELFAFDVVGDVAWSAGFLRFKVAIDGGPTMQRTLRITHVYRREHDEWKIAHEHSNWET